MLKHVSAGRFRRTFCRLAHREFSGRSRSALRRRRRAPRRQSTHPRRRTAIAQAPIVEVHVSRKRLTIALVRRAACYCSRGAPGLPVSTRALARHWRTKWRPRAPPRSCRAGRTPRTITSWRRLSVSNVARTNSASLSRTEAPASVAGRTIFLSRNALTGPLGEELLLLLLTLAEREIEKERAREGERETERIVPRRRALHKNARSRMRVCRSLRLEPRLDSMRSVLRPRLRGYLSYARYANSFSLSRSRRHVYRCPDIVLT